MDERTDEPKRKTAVRGIVIGDWYGGDGHHLRARDVEGTLAGPPVPRDMRRGWSPV